MLGEILFGTIIGVVAGLVPGLHSNTFAAILVVYADKESAWIVIISSAIAYTVSNIVPTTLLGVPDEDTAIATYPAHEMVLEGRGFEAISISAFSSFLSLIFSLPLFLSAIVIGVNYDFIQKITPFILISISVFLIMSEKADIFEGSLASWRKRLYALLVFTTSGLLGLVALEHSYLAEVNPAGSVLLPLLTGLFGAPVLMQTTGGRIPKQKLEMRFPNVNSVARGSLAGFAVSIFPGISSGIATAIASFGERRKEEYIAAISGANTSNALLCFYMLIAASKARSGAAEAIKKLGYIPSYTETITVSLISGIVALIATLPVSFVIVSKIEKMRPRILSALIFAFLILVVHYFTGIFGLTIFFASIPIGLAASLLEVKRVNCMGCLLVPVLIHYL